MLPVLRLFFALAHGTTHWVSWAFRGPTMQQKRPRSRSLCSSFLQALILSINLGLHPSLHSYWATYLSWGQRAIPQSVSVSLFSSVSLFGKSEPDRGMNHSQSQLIPSFCSLLFLKSEPKMSLDLSLILCSVSVWKWAKNENERDCGIALMPQCSLYFRSWVVTSKKC